MGGVSLAGIVATAATAALASAPSSSGPHLFSLATERASYLVGEPVYLRMESKRLRVPSLEEGAFLLAIQGDGEPERIYHPPLRYRRGSAAKAGSKAGAGEEIPGAAASERVRFARIVCADGDLVFRKPGHYRLRLIGVPAGQAGQPQAGSPVLSDAVGITFRAPEAEEDKKAYAILMRNPAEYGLAMYLEGGDQLHDGMAIVSELAASRSAYTRAASFVLSSDWSQDFNDYAGAKSRPLDLQKALAWAQWDKENGAYIPIRNAYRLAAAAALLSRRSPAEPGLVAVLARNAAFLASLSPEETIWFRSF